MVGFLKLFGLGIGFAIGCTTAGLAVACLGLWLLGTNVSPSVPIQAFKQMNPTGAMR